jgi:hypothetical protein
MEWVGVSEAIITAGDYFGEGDYIHLKKTNAMGGCEVD